MTQEKPRLFDLGRIVMRRFDEDRCTQIASSLTFTTLLSIVPMVTVALTVIAAFPAFGKVTAALQQFIVEYMLPDSIDVITTYAEQFTKNTAKLTAVGIGFLAVTSIMTLLTIERAFNDIWRIRRARGIVQRVFIYWSLITIGPVLIGASLSLTSWLVGQAVGVVRGVPGVGVALLTVVPIILTSAALSLLYAAMPNRRIVLRDAVAGGVVGGVAFEIMKRGFAFYVAEFPSYTLVYGAFATVPIFLLWIYLSWLVVISGAVLVASLPEWRAGSLRSGGAPGSEFYDALQVLKVLWQAHRKGVVVKLADVLAVATVRIEQVEMILERMMAAGWVSRALPTGWVMHHDPTTITVGDVYRSFVFQGDGHQPARAADTQLEYLIRELGTRAEADFALSVDTLFRAAEGGEALPVAASAGPVQGGH